jgi:hypothetical protein
MERVLPQQAELNNVLDRARVFACFYTGEQVTSATAIAVVLDQLTEAERKLAKIAKALNGDGSRTA